MGSMHITFLTPDIHDRPTGGNIYNRRIITELRRRISLEVVQWPLGANAPPAVTPEAGRHWVVDSLLLSQETARRLLRTSAPQTTLVLLAHYLHCIDPGEEHSPKANTERAVLDVFDGIVTPSQYAKEALLALGVPRGRVRVVPPGLDAPFRTPPPSRPVHPPPDLLTVANVQPGKGLLDLVEALEELMDLSWTWTLVGGTDLARDHAEIVLERIRASPIVDRTTLPGTLSPSKLRRQYDASDVFVLPSHFETCSMATREAMARGLPIVAYDVGGLSENLGDAPAGHLVSTITSDGLRTPLRSLITDPSARHRMGRNAREQSERFPTWDEASRRLRTFLAELSPLA